VSGFYSIPASLPGIGQSGSGSVFPQREDAGVPTEFYPVLAGEHPLTTEDNSAMGCVFER
jgi:hypothetical protein